MTNLLLTLLAILVASFLLSITIFLLGVDQWILEQMKGDRK